MQWILFFKDFVYRKNLKAEYFAEITDIVASGTINRNTAKDVISELLQGNPLSPLEVSALYKVYLKRHTTDVSHENKAIEPSSIIFLQFFLNVLQTTNDIYFKFF